MHHEDDPLPLPALANIEWIDTVITDRDKAFDEVARRTVVELLVVPHRLEPVHLRDALKAAIDFADEGWAYASDYFREKWDYAGQRAALVAELPPE